MPRTPQKRVIRLALLFGMAGIQHSVGFQSPKMNTTPSHLPLDMGLKARWDGCDPVSLWPWYLVQPFLHQAYTPWSENTSYYETQPGNGLGGRFSILGGLWFHSFHYFGSMSSKKSSWGLFLFTDPVLGLEAVIPGQSKHRQEIICDNVQLAYPLLLSELKGPCQLQFNPHLWDTGFLIFLSKTNRNISSPISCEVKNV